MHGPGLRIAGAHSRFLLGFFSALARLPLLQLFQRTLQPLLLLASCAYLGLLGFRTALLGPRIAHLRHPSLRPLQMLANRFLLAITPTARQSLDLGAILHHLFQGDQPFLAERRQHLREQFIEFLLLFARLKFTGFLHTFKSTWTVTALLRHVDYFRVAREELRNSRAEPAITSAMPTLREQPC